MVLNYHIIFELVFKMIKAIFLEVQDRSIQIKNKILLVFQYYRRLNNLCEIASIKREKSNWVYFQFINTSPAYIGQSSIPHIVFLILIWTISGGIYRWHLSYKRLSVSDVVTTCSSDNDNCAEMRTNLYILLYIRPFITEKYSLEGVL